MANAAAIDLIRVDVWWHQVLLTPTRRSRFAQLAIV